MFTQRSALVQRIVAAAFTVVLFLGAWPWCTGNGIGLMGQVANAAEPSGSCQDASRWLQNDLHNSRLGNPAGQRYLSGLAASRSWLDVAASCPSHFGEGVMKSAQMHHASDVSARALGIEPSHENAAVENLNDVTDLGLPDAALEQLALAEDRAGFEVGVLAARNTPDATLALSDAHKATAERLIWLTDGHGRPGSNDTRQKVYDVSALLEHPDVIEDPATKLTAPTLAVVEMTCARADIAALNNAGGKRGFKKSARQPENQNAMTNLATLVGFRTYLALTLGYPATDAALFEN
jgi:hypothetical protein